MSGIPTVAGAIRPATITAAAGQRRTSTSTFDAASGDTPPPPAAGDEVRLQWAARQLESVLLREMLLSMRRTIPDGGLFTQSFAGETYEDMLWEERAKAMVQAGGIGLADVVLAEWRA